MTIKGRQLFVGNLPFIVGWQDLKDLFRSAGNVQRANIMQSRDGRSKGHGIVLYATVTDAQKAISTFDGYEWHGRRLEVREDRDAMEYPPPPPRTEGASSIIQNETDNEDVTTPNGVTTTSLNEITSSGNTPTQPASPVEYPAESVHAINGSNGGYADESTTSTVTTNSSTATAVNGFSTVEGNVQRQLFVGNLPFRVRWQDLKDLFRKAGMVLRADVAMGYDNRSKGHGTVLFQTLEDARNAIAMFHNYNWQGRILEVREDRGFVDSNSNHNSGYNINIRNNQFPLAGRPILGQHSQNPFVPGAMIAPSIFYGQPRGIQPPAALNYAGRLLFVGNLPFNCQWQDLKDLFRNAGNVIRADVSTNNDGKSRGFGTVLFATPDDARKAVAMYNGHEFQGRTLRVHLDKFALPTMTPHPHAPHPHMQPVHPHHHHRPPPLIPNLPHNFHLGPPMHHPPHFLPAHLGPFSPPLTTPALTSPPPYPTYNPLAHLGSATPNSTNGVTQFQPIPMIPPTTATNGVNVQQSTTNPTHGLISPDKTIQTPSSGGQFPGFGPIGKSHAQQTIGNGSSISNLSPVGFPTMNTSNGMISANGSINGTEMGFGSTGNENSGIQGLTSAVATLNLNSPPPSQQLFFHPVHLHHRPPVVPTAYHHHHNLATIQHHQQPHHQHHHPGAIGSGIVGGISSNQYIHHSHANVTATNNVSAQAGLNGVSQGNSSSTGAIDSEAGESNNVLIGASSTTDIATNGTNGTTGGSATNSIVQSSGIWDNGTTGIPNGTNGTNNTNAGVMGINMATLAGISLDTSTGTGIASTTPQSVFVRNI